jgi:hypothetical protein
MFDLQVSDLGKARSMECSRMKTQNRLMRQTSEGQAKPVLQCMHAEITCAHRMHEGK